MEIKDLKIGDPVLICTLDRKNSVQRFQEIVAEVTDSDLTVVFQVDVPRTFKFDRTTGKQVNDDTYWLEIVNEE